MAVSIIYISTNESWGGSEVLWSSSAKLFKENGADVKIAVYYNSSFVTEVFEKRSSLFDLNKRFRFPSLPGKVVQKIFDGKYRVTDRLAKWLKTGQPDLVVISQGNNIAGSAIMQLCRDNNIRYVTVVQLVSEHVWPSLTDEKIDQLRSVYRAAEMNFFVSDANLLLHNMILGEQPLNASVVYNPFTGNVNDGMCYPIPRAGVYKIAMVGRTEFFHKGIDILVTIARQEKWRSRPVKFSVFGNGPHTGLLRRLVNEYQLTSVSIEDHVSDISTIWRDHHLLLMPSRMEGQSLSFIEAMYHARPSVATRVGGVEGLIEEGVNGFIADCATVSSVDAALERAWSRREEWEDIGRNARDTIKRLHPDDAVSFFNQQILDVLGRKKT